MIRLTLLFLNIYASDHHKNVWFLNNIYKKKLQRRCYYLILFIVSHESASFNNYYYICLVYINKRKILF